MITTVIISSLVLNLVLGLMVSSLSKEKPNNKTKTIYKDRIVYRDKPVEKIILLYDGRFTSVFSMRQFAFLFSHYAHLPIELFCVRAMDEDLHLPDHWYLKEWMRRHFKQVNYHVVKGIPEIEIIRFLKEQPDSSLLVMGARRRIMLSRWMRTGLLESILQEKDIPVFIAHS